MPVLLLYLLCKSIDWFLYEGNTGTEWVSIDFSRERKPTDNSYIVTIT